MQYRMSSKNHFANMKFFELFIKSIHMGARKRASLRSQVVGVRITLMPDNRTEERKKNKASRAVYDFN